LQGNDPGSKIVAVASSRPDNFGLNEWVGKGELARWHNLCLEYPGPMNPVASGGTVAIRRCRADLFQNWLEENLAINCVRD